MADDKLEITQEEFELACDTWQALVNASSAPGHRVHILEQAFAAHRHRAMTQAAEAAAGRALEAAAKVAEERAAGREALFNENGGSINAAKAVEAEEIATAIRSLDPSQIAADTVEGR